MMLAQILLVSSLGLFASVPEAHAHEVSTTVSDLTVHDSGALDLTLQITLESFLAGIDLDTITDTNAAPQAARYDALRALPPDTLRAQFQQESARITAPIKLRSTSGPVALTLERIEVPQIGDVDLERTSKLYFQGTLPKGDSWVQLDWPKGYGPMVLRQFGPENPYTGYINGGGQSPEIALSGQAESAGFAAVLAQYIPVGFDHILPKGQDHILFVLGLFLFSTAIGPLLVQVTSFTLAHTVTLALGALGLVVVPGSIVEPIIAASIVYVAVENIFARKMTPWRPVLIFVFGLLHGLGFASVLGEFGLPGGQFIAALIGFNIGVELGQLTVIALAFLAVGYWFGQKPWYRQFIVIPASVVIAGIGAYWCIQRVFF